MSFGLTILRDTWNPSHTERELVEVDLHEVSIVAFSAYTQTTIEARSLGLPADAEVLTYQMPPVTDEERERLRRPRRRVERFCYLFASGRRSR